MIVNLSMRAHVRGHGQDLVDGVRVRADAELVLEGFRHKRRASLLPRAYTVAVADRERAPFLHNAERAVPGRCSGAPLLSPPGRRTSNTCMAMARPRQRKRFCARRGWRCERLECARVELADGKFGDGEWQWNAKFSYEHVLISRAPFRGTVVPGF